MRIRFCHEIPQAAAVEYAFGVLSASLDCDIVTGPGTDRDQADILVSYGVKVPAAAHRNHLHILADPPFWEGFGTARSLPTQPLHRLPLADLRLKANKRLSDPLICPYLSRGVDTGVVEWTDAGPGGGQGPLVCRIDLLASALFWITCYEEAFLPDRDEFGGIPEDRLTCVRENCQRRPLVDEYAEALAQWLGHLGVPVGRKPAEGRVLITHDVDSGVPVRGGTEYFENGLRSLYREAVRARRLRAGLSSFGRWLAVGLGGRPYTGLFRDIIALDRRYGFTSHFFMMANGTNPRDAQYDIFSRYSREIIREIRSAGGEIGLHFGIDCHRSASELTSEWNRLRQAVPDALSATRGHWLVFHNADTWKRLGDVGCRVDSTAGFNLHAGFRAGTCRPFRPFDIVTRTVSPVWEYPMSLMDLNLFLMRSRSDGERIDSAREIIDTVMAHGGCLVVNWHNVHVFSDYLHMYTAVLDYVAGRGLDVPLQSTPEPAGRLIW